MKKILTLFLTLGFILSFQQNSQAYDHSGNLAFKSFADAKIQNQDKILFLFEKHNSRKLSLDDLVIESSKVIYTNGEESISDMVNKNLSTDENMLLYFIAYVYTNYDKISDKAKKEFRKTPYCLDEYTNKQFSSEEMTILKSIGKKFLDENDNVYKYDLIDAFQKLADTGHISYSEAAIHIILIGIFRDVVKLDYNINIKEFNQGSLFIWDWITVNYAKISNEKYMPVLKLLIGSAWSLRSILIDFKHKNDKSYFIENRGIFNVQYDPDYPNA